MANGGGGGGWLRVWLVLRVTARYDGNYVTLANLAYTLLLASHGTHHRSAWKAELSVLVET